MASVVKDSKGPSYIVSTKRCGITQAIFVSPEELVEIRDQIDKILKDS
jgi:hypothetical protein